MNSFLILGIFKCINASIRSDLWWLMLTRAHFGRQGVWMLSGRCGDEVAPNEGLNKIIKIDYLVLVDLFLCTSRTKDAEIYGLKSSQELEQCNAIVQNDIDKCF